VFPDAGIVTGDGGASGGAGGAGGAAGSAGTGSTPPGGQLGGPCFSNNTCNDSTLACVDGFCRTPIVAGWASCPAPALFVPSCAGAGGADGGADAGYADAGYADAAVDASETMDGAAGDSGDSGLPPWCSDSAAGGTAETSLEPIPTSDGSGRTLLLIDDFEDDGQQHWVTRYAFGGRGGWFMANDGSGAQYPWQCLVTSPNDRASDLLDSSARALHVFGSGFSQVLGNARFAQVGASLLTNAPGCVSPMDASTMTGVRFLARAGLGATLGNASMRFSLQTAETNPPEAHGLCDNTIQGSCYNAHGTYFTVSEQWTEFLVPFSFVAQEQDWGTQVPFDPTQLLGMVWEARDSAERPPCFDFWIDDVAFYKDN
jgi:hypothetical protein